MQEFRFCSELFEYRSTAIETMSKHGLDLFTNFGTIDVLHDVFGLEVCGIPEESDALKILSVLRTTFPNWRHFDMFEKDSGILDLGWQVSIHRDQTRALGF